MLPEAEVREWFRREMRPLPWRVPPRAAWGTLVSEVMLQQTQVARVAPVWDEWMRRWPAPRALAVEAPGEAVRAWGRLGYPRRAVRLHAAARVIESVHGGVVPGDEALLRQLPGVGVYTAAAVLAFAFRRRVAVIDTNVRRVLARAVDGRSGPARSAPTRDERELLDATLPALPEEAAELSEALMELGAVVCTARRPACGACPMRDSCRWNLAGAPEDPGPRATTPPYRGSDRQARGEMLQLLRDASGPVSEAELEATWPDADQRDRARQSLIVDGLLIVDEGMARLP